MLTQCESGFRWSSVLHHLITSNAADHSYFVPLNHIMYTLKIKLHCSQVQKSSLWFKGFEETANKMRITMHRTSNASSQICIQYIRSERLKKWEESYFLNNWMFNLYEFSRSVYFSLKIYNFVIVKFDEGYTFILFYFLSEQWQRKLMIVKKFFNLYELIGFLYFSSTISYFVIVML